MYYLISDSACDVFEIPGKELITVPLHIGTKEKEYTDDEKLDVHEMLEYLSQYRGKSHSACPSAEAWEKALAILGPEDEAYLVTLTSGLSGTYNAACLAKQNYEEIHPTARIAIIDSLTVGPEMYLILEKLVELKKAGKDFYETCDLIRAYQEHTRTFFALQSLHNLVQNGRVSKLSAIAAGALNISILGTASSQGTLEMLHKCRGKKGTLKAYLEELEKAGYSGGKCYLCHIENEALAADLTAAIRSKWPQAVLRYYPARGLCSFYAERGGIILGCECQKA